MPATCRAESEFHRESGAPAPRLVLDVSTTHGTHVIRVAGELDLANRDQLVAASMTGRHSATVIDLGGLTFMDCSGYGSVVATRRIVEGHGGSLTVRGQAGQPARLLELIADAEKRQRLDG